MSGVQDKTKDIDESETLSLKQKIQYSLFLSHLPLVSPPSLTLLLSLSLPSSLYPSLSISLSPSLSLPPSPPLRSVPESCSKFPSSRWYNYKSIWKESLLSHIPWWEYTKAVSAARKIYAKYALNSPIMVLIYTASIFKFNFLNF